ncbi:hypothetical protein [Streptomyces sp. IBSBF 2950]
MLEAVRILDRDEGFTDPWKAVLITARCSSVSGGAWSTMASMRAQ